MINLLVMPTMIIGIHTIKGGHGKTKQAGLKKFKDTYLT